MTNFEYYAKNDAENFSNFFSMHKGLAVYLSDNKEVLANCNGTSCSACLFRSVDCHDGRKEWLLSEHKGDVGTSNDEGGISW